MLVANSYVLASWRPPDNVLLHILDVVAAPAPEVELDLAVEAEDLTDVRHLPHAAHHLEHALGGAVFLYYLKEIRA